MAIFEPKILSQRKLERIRGQLNMGLKCIHSMKMTSNHNFEVDYFKIKLGYNGIHHYFPIIPKGVMQYF